MIPAQRLASLRAIRYTLPQAFPRGYPFVPHSRLTIGRAMLLAGFLGLALTACGRKGPLEPPPDSKNAIDLPAQQTGAVENSFDATNASPLGKPAKRNRPIEVPEKPFVLDPLL